MGFLWKYFHKYQKHFFMAVAFLTVEAFCDLLQPTIMARIVDIGVAGRKIDYVLQMGGAMLVVTCIGAVSAVSRNIISSNVSQRFGAELRSDIYKKVHSFSFDNIDHFKAASLVTRLTNDITQVQNFAHGLMRIFVKAPLLCIGSLIMAVLLNPSMAVVLLVIIPVVGILISISMKIGFPYFLRVQNAMDKMNGVMREYLAGVRVVKAFNRFDYERARFDESNTELSAASTKAMRIMSFFNPAITLSVNLGILAILWLGGIKVGNGSIRVGQVIAFINYMTQILFSIIMISHVFNMFVMARASAERIGEVMAQESTMPEAENPVNISEAEGSIEYDHVFFAYAQGAESVLKDISFKCMQGESIGIIGSTGAGKSSLVNLIPRFYDVSSGSVKVGGTDVRNMDQRKLRDMVAVVPQKNMLFTGTIIDNLRWGREDAGLEEIRQAAASAQADEFISSFPEGYDTVLGQGGVNLSGGQKQRISIARALIKTPKILILDDCTSAVDVATEAKIRAAVKKESRDMTTIIIAQRITSVMGADRIMVLDNGGMAGMGTHKELLEGCDVYKEIFRSQIGKEGV
ncbi:MAG: ABC transporter ATP-binding protein [Clostridiaceae bacterium]|nr:ABC transporter ATP-binding protein [Clostridiaceae bacterium]